MKVLCMSLVFIFLMTLLEFDQINGKGKKKEKPSRCQKSLEKYYKKLKRKPGQSISKEQYKYFKECGIDRSLQPPTYQDCLRNGNLEDLQLRFCDMVVNHANQIWGNSPLPYSHTLRGKRDLVNNIIVPSRTRRAVPGNPCTTSQSVPLYFYYGTKVIGNQEVVEIVQDPLNQHYQQFLTYQCAESGYGGLECRSQSIEYIALVYDGPGVSYQQIKVATTCGIYVGG